jgi:hypothetical protein
VLGTSRAILNADQFNVRQPMIRPIYLFQFALVLLACGFVGSIFLPRGQRRKVLGLILGVITTLVGILTLVTGVMHSRYHLGPTVTGGTAKIGGLIYLFVGLYAIFQAVMAPDPDERVHRE